MSESKKPTGSIVWTDLTIPNANEVKDFYKKVIGWDTQEFNMGDYNDYVVCNKGTENAVAGICHKKGSNANIPSVWLVYVSVENVAASVAKVVDLGGEVLDGPRIMDGNNFAVIKDPTGAIMAIIEN